MSKSKWVVAFGPDESYFFCNKQKAIWKGIPEGLAKALKDDVRLSPDKLWGISLGPNKSYFIKSSEASAWGNVPPMIETKVGELGGWNTVAGVMFSADPDSFIILDTKAQLYGNKLDQDFYDAIFRHSVFGLKDYALGVDGGYVLCTKNKMVSYKNVTEEFVKAWKQAAVEQVFMSPFNRFFFIEYENGESAYSCPSGWHSAIDELQQTIRKSNLGNPMGNASALDIQRTSNLQMEALAQSAALEQRRHQTAMTIINNMGGTRYDRWGRPIY